MARMAGHSAAGEILASHRVPASPHQLRRLPRRIGSSHDALSRRSLATRLRRVDRLTRIGDFAMTQARTIDLSKFLSSGGTNPRSLDWVGIVDDGASFPCLLPGERPSLSPLCL